MKYKTRFTNIDKAYSGDELNCNNDCKQEDYTTLVTVEDLLPEA